MNPVLRLAKERRDVFWLGCNSGTHFTVRICALPNRSILRMAIPSGSSHNFDSKSICSSLNCGALFCTLLLLLLLLFEAELFVELLRLLVLLVLLDLECE